MRIGRPKKKPGFDLSKLNEKTLLSIKGEFNSFIREHEADTESDSFRMVKEFADIHDMSPGKMRKILITAGVFENDMSRLIAKLHGQGKSIDEIQKLTGLKKSAVNSYLPYTKGIYKQEETSVDADRIRLYRKRQKICKQLKGVIAGNGTDAIMKSDAYSLLWEALMLFQGYPFIT